jgi:hypothetical protein
MGRRACAASRAFSRAGHSIRLVGHHRQQVVGGVLSLTGSLENRALVVAERGQPVLDIRGMVFAFLDLETDNRADEGCAQLGYELVPRIVGAAR